MRTSNKEHARRRRAAAAIVAMYMTDPSSIEVVDQVRPVLRVRSQSGKKTKGLGWEAPVCYMVDLWTDICDCQSKKPCKHLLASRMLIKDRMVPDVEYEKVAGLGHEEVQGEDVNEEGGGMDCEEGVLDSDNNEEANEGLEVLEKERDVLQNTVADLEKKVKTFCEVCLDVGAIVKATRGLKTAVHLLDDLLQPMQSTPRAHHMDRGKIDRQQAHVKATRMGHGKASSSAHDLDSDAELDPRDGGAELGPEFVTQASTGIDPTQKVHQGPKKVHMPSVALRQGGFRGVKRVKFPSRSAARVVKVRCSCSHLTFIPTGSVSWRCANCCKEGSCNVDNVKPE